MEESTEGSSSITKTLNFFRELFMAIKLPDICAGINDKIYHFDSLRDEEKLLFFAAKARPPYSSAGENIFVQGYAKRLLNRKCFRNI